MEAEERRKRIVRILKERNTAVSGGRLAEELGVSRQVIVQDIALLRASGENIFATPQGYISVSAVGGRIRKVFACVHGVGGMGEELLTIVQAGGRVLDVIVEHPLYGELRGLLTLATPADVRDFLQKCAESQAELLSALTRGVHLHTVEADSAEALDAVEKALRNNGFLIRQT